MSRIIIVVCLVGLTALACGPATPEPVREGEPVQGGSQGESGGLQSPAEPTGDGTAVGRAGDPQVQGGAADQDFDGILDLVDRCADTPEDLDGFQDEDGCPDPDNDQDGLSDVDDMCPAGPEDLDGFQDEDGCPDP